MSDTPQNNPRYNATGLSRSGDLSGISEMFGLRDGQQADTGTGTGTDTVGRWVAATEGADQPPDVSSRLVHGRYRLIAELGVGGMGVTYRAWDTKAGIPVVVKMPRREVRSDSEAMQRFAREIDAMLAVPHERIVPITDHGDDDGCPFVVMRFLPGGSLADYRRRDEAGNAIRNPPGMLHFWLPGVAAALDHIHAKGMLHRDVKPGNIVLDGFLKPYLGDFGIAKVVDESGGLQKEQTLTATKMAVGTPEYMAPELFKPRSKPDGRVDQYALAVTVYEMLSGEKPFKGDRAHIIVEHSAMPVPPLAQRVPGLPQSLCAAVERGLTKSAADRFPTCREFAAAVVAELAALPLEADAVRLLCPSCKNILKLPQKAAGRTGKCLRCQAAIDVAADLGSLWLEAEERGGGTAFADRLVPTRTDYDVIRFPPLDSGLGNARSILWVHTTVTFTCFYWWWFRLDDRIAEGDSWWFWLFFVGFLPVLSFVQTAFVFYGIQVLIHFGIGNPIEVWLTEVGDDWIRGTCVDNAFAPPFLGSRGAYDSLTIPTQDIHHVKFVRQGVRRELTANFKLVCKSEFTTFKLVCKAEPQRAPVWTADTSAATLRKALEAKGITILDDDAT